MSDPTAPGSAFGVPTDVDWPSADADTPPAVPAVPPRPAPQAPTAPAVPVRAPVQAPSGPAVPTAVPARAPVTRPPAIPSAPTQPAPVRLPAAPVAHVPPPPAPSVPPSPAVAAPPAPAPPVAAPPPTAQPEPWISPDPEPWREDAWTANPQGSPATDTTYVTASTHVVDDEDGTDDSTVGLLDGISSGLNPKKGGRKKRTRPDSSPANTEAGPRILGFPLPVRAKPSPGDTPAVSASRLGVGNSSLGLRIFRVVFIGFLALAVLAGLRTMFFPPATPSVTAIADKVQEKLNLTAFPSTAASGFASGFASTYLNYLPDQTDSRKANLATYMPGLDVETYAGTFTAWQYVTNGPYVMSVNASDANNATVTVSAAVAPTADGAGRWVTIDVPVTVNATGNFAVAGAPTLMPVSPSPAVEQVKQDFTVDTDAQASLTQFLPLFFQAWARTDTSSLNQFLAPTATQNARTGLAGAVSPAPAFISEIKIPTVDTQPTITPAVTPPAGSTAREAWVKLAWQDPSRNQFTQVYRVTLFQNTATGTWLVQDVSGGVSLTNAAPAPESDSETSAPASPPPSSAS